MIAQNKPSAHNKYERPKKKEDAVKHMFPSKKSYFYSRFSRFSRAFNLLKRHHRIVVTEKNDLRQGGGGGEEGEPQAGGRDLIHTDFRVKN